MLKIGDEVKVVGLTNCGGIEKEIIQKGTICEVVNIEKTETGMMAEIMPKGLKNQWNVGYWYYEKDVEKGKSQWIKETDKPTFYTQIGKIDYGEISVINQKTNDRYTLVDSRDIFRSDYYTITVYNAIHEVAADVVPQPNKYVCKVSYMDTDCTLIRRFVDYDTMENLIRENLAAFMQDNRVANILRKFFERETMD